MKTVVCFGASLTAGTVSLPRRIGRHATLLLAVGPASIDAVTALRWGLVDELGP